MALQEEQDRDGRSYSLEDLESPFLREELFGGETGAEWEARLAALEAESPFLREFLPGAAAVDPFPLQYSLGDAAASSREADRRFKRVAALVTDGLKVSKDAIPQLSANGQQELLRFMASLLENFFPRGHGLIDAQAKVRRQSKIGTVAVPVIAKDGSRWPFEHRVRLYLSDQIGFRKSGEHLTGNFSSIRLFT